MLCSRHLCARSSRLLLLRAGGTWPALRRLAGAGSRGFTVALPLLSPASPYARPRRAPTLSSVTVRAQAAAVPAATAKASSFNEFGLCPEAVAAAQGVGISVPTEIQAMAIPRLLAGGADFLLASHTGSGKTLAYLLPLVHHIKGREVGGEPSRPRRPKALVLGPTKELADQITRVAKELCHHAKFRATCLSANRPMKLQRDSLAAPIDLVVGTPTRVLQHVDEGSVFFGDVQWLVRGEVIDEADTMFDQGFGPDIQRIVQPLKRLAPPVNVVLVSATMSKAVKRLIAETLSGVVPIQTTSFHRGVAGSKHDFLYVPRGADKLETLVTCLGADARRRHKTLIFCNTVASCRAVEHYCAENGVPTVCYHGDMPIPQRKEAIANFSGANPDAEGGADGSGQPVMVATDLAARGLDFPGQVDHVVNFDFPRNPVDYLHRTGRTARAGAAGRITSICAGGERVLAQRIEWALDHNEPLDGLSADKAVLPPGMLPKRREGDSGGERGRGGRDASSTGRGGGERGRSAGGGRGGRDASSDGRGGASSGRGGFSSATGRGSGGRGGGSAAPALGPSRGTRGAARFESPEGRGGSGRGGSSSGRGRGRGAGGGRGSGGGRGGGRGSR